jgi:acyl-CoA synthetase (AMP-forming)/AMP-acid ligase II
MGRCDTESAAAHNIAHLLWSAAARAGDCPAVIERGRLTTYDALRAHAAGVAEALVACGIRPGDRVAIFLERGAAAVAAYFGALVAGGIVTIINERLRPRQIEHVLQHASASALISAAELLVRQPRAIETSAHLLDIGTVPLAGGCEPLPVRPGDLAQLIYTSGSTGLPKGVMLTHHAVRSAIDVVTSYLGLAPDDRIASLIPFSSVYGLNQLLCAARTGAVLVVERSPVPHQIAAELRAHETTVLATVPPLWLQLLRVPAFRDERVPSLRVLQNAGGHLPVEAARRLRAAQPHAQLFLQYGMTETFRSTFLAPDEVDRHPHSIGRAIPGAEILVLRDDGTPCEVGEIGELVHRGPTVAAGYWNDPEATARVFRPHPCVQRAGDQGTAPDAERVVFSGDLVRRDAEGLLYFVSRRDRVIKSLGFRIGPDEILDVLHASGEITEGVVTTEPDGQRGERIIACVVLAPEGSAHRLEAYCRVELPRHMQPTRIDVLDEIPHLPGGKHDLAALRERQAAT